MSRCCRTIGVEDEPGRCYPLVSQVIAEPVTAPGGMLQAQGQKPFPFEQITVYNLESSVLATPRLVPFGKMEEVWRYM